ncbi:MAG: URC4/urg3 family protein [Symploca sp. SIO2E6]|nr:URC4/urg3 family protein [Symploca sp. SIO2E6]
MAESEQRAIAYLRTPAAIRKQCDRLFSLTCAEELPHFRCHLTKLEQVAEYVIQVMREQYPDLNIPFHSRWRHFEVGNLPRLDLLEEKLAGLTPREKARTKYDLAMVSVLLDAGAGAAWKYYEQETGQVFSRSEGLAVASFRMFCQGAFSSDSEHPLQADAQGLQSLTVAKLAQGFQVSQGNPLVGIEGRWQLLQRLGESLQTFPHLFGTENPRPGNLVNYLLDGSVGRWGDTETRRRGDAEMGRWGDKEDKEDKGDIDNSQTTNNQQPTTNNQQPTTNDKQQTTNNQQQTTNNQQPTTNNKQLSASKVLTAILEGLGNIWPGRVAIAGVNLGDVWFHPALEGEHLGEQYVPFHKLSQWLTYSLLEPLQELGCEITGLDELTGLPEYRNGGLCLDLGLLEVKDTAILHQPHLPGSEVIVEWRALTVCLLDRIADVIRQQLNLSTVELPLVKILQGGTWSTGRRIAAQLRAGGVPPIQIESDGTVF